jgi:signal transduction histidine kinase
VVTLVLGIAESAVGEPGQEVLWALAMSAIPLGIVIAVVRHHLLDIEVVLNRTVVYGLLSAVVLLGYLIAVAGVGPAAQRTGLVAVVVLALLAASARDRVQRAVDRLLFGYRKDPYAVVTRVGQRLDAAAGPLDALQQLTAELRSALRLPSAAVIPDDPQLAPVEAGRPVAGTVDFPVTMQGRQVATLRVGLRHRGARFRPDEQSALTDVGRRVGALVQAAVLVTDLQRSRETLVAAREEERRRLRQDLHDGVGPELAGMALQLDSLASRLGDQADLAGRARVLRDRMRQTVADVRRVVDDLRPAALDELGLAEALRQHLALFAVGPAGGPGAPAHPTDIVIDPILPVMPPLPAAVEVAAYRIVSEAVANAVRHGRASTCTVRLAAAGGQLVLVVADNGTGILPSASAGVGLASMHDRAAELGGDLQIETGSAGTVVRSRLPLEVGP